MSNQTLRYFILIVGLCSLVHSQSPWIVRLAKDPVRANPDIDVDPSVPTPESVIGYSMGERYGTTSELHAYLDAVAKTSPRVKVASYGTSGLGRPLKVAYVTDPKNLTNLDGLMERSAAIPHGVKATMDHPLVVFLLAGVHGDEASGGEAMLGLLHFLASDRGASTQELLRRVIVVIDPAVNPDGRDRFVTASRDREGVVPEPDPLSYEHQQGWPSGRTSRNGFDLNRDWFLAVEPETQARLKLLNQWCPQVVADLHEMPSNEAYYSSTPPCPPVNEHCSDHVKSLWRVMGESIESHFTTQRTISFNRALYPLDYPGYGGTYTSLRGACGMTFEQGMPAGRSILRNDGSTLTLFDAALHHATASLATLRACTLRHDEILTTYQDHFAAQITLASTDHLPVFIFPPGGDALCHDEFRDLLIRNAIRVEVTQDPMTVDAFDLDGTGARTMTFPVGSLIVATNQPYRPLVKALLDPNVVMEESFRKDEEARLARGERSQVYDVTAWNVPLSFGHAGYRLATLPAAIRRAPAASTHVHMSPPSTTDAMAVVVGGDGLGVARVLAAWWAKGIRTRIATAAFTTAKHSFPRGSIIALGERQSESQLALAAAEAVRVGMMPIALSTLATETGPSLGTSSMRVVAAPRITLAFGAPFNVNSAGALRRFFKAEVGVPILTASVDRSLPKALSVTDVLVLPDADPDALVKALSESDVKGFVHRGGTVVAMKGAVLALAALGLPGVHPLTAPPEQLTLEGPLLSTHVDPESFLAFGVPSNLAVQPRVKSLWKLSDDKQVAVRFLGGKALSGELPHLKQRHVAGATFAGNFRVGQGGVIVFADDPTLRGATPGLYRLLANAVMLAPAFGR